MIYIYIECDIYIYTYLYVYYPAKNKCKVSKAGCANLNRKCAAVKPTGANRSELGETPKYAHNLSWWC